jgi:hypothetical protein
MPINGLPVFKQQPVAVNEFLDRRNVPLEYHGRYHKWDRQMESQFGSRYLSYFNHWYRMSGYPSLQRDSDPMLF